MMNKRLCNNNHIFAIHYHANQLTNRMDDLSTDPEAKENTFTQE